MNCSADVVRSRETRVKWLRESWFMRRTGAGTSPQEFGETARTGSMWFLSFVLSRSRAHCLLGGDSAKLYLGVVAEWSKALPC